MKSVFEMKLQKKSTMKQRQGKEQAMFYGNYDSMIVHYQQCQHVRGKREKMVAFHHLQSARNKGYRLCSCCAPLVKKAHLRSTATKNFCERHHMTIRVVDGELHIRTLYSVWILKSDKSKIVLFHGNHRGNVSKYHRQAFRAGTVFAYLDYIVDHDMYRVEHPYKEQRVEEESLPLPRKGTKNYRKMVRDLKERKRQHEIKHVLDLIDRLSM